MTADTGRVPNRDGAADVVTYLRGIGGRLLAAQFVIVAMAVIGLGLAVSSFGDVTVLLNKITTQRIPVMTSALALARDSEHLNVLAPALLGAATDDQRRQEAQGITRGMAVVQDRLREVRDYKLAEAEVDHIEAGVKQLGANLARIDALVAEGLTIEAKVKILLDTVSGARNAAQEEIGPALNTSTLRISLTSQSIKADSAPGDIAAAAADLRKALGENQPMLDLQREVQMAAGALGDVVNAKSPDAINQLAFKFKGSMKTVRTALKSLPANLAEHIKTQYDILAKAGDPATGIPAMWLRRLALRGESAALIEENHKTTGEIGVNIEHMVSHARTEVDKSSVETGDILGERSRLLIGFAVATVLLSLLVSFWFVGRNIVGPLITLATLMRNLAAGNMAVSIPGETRGDEIGEMARAVVVFKKNTIEMERLREEQAALKNRQEEARREGLIELGNELEHTVTVIMTTMISAAEEMKHTATSMSTIATETSKQADAVAHASEEATHNV